MRRVYVPSVRKPGKVVIEILRSFEQVGGRFSPVVLLAPGLAMVALGLVAWLAGMCVRRLGLAVAGAAAGGIAGWLVHGQNPTVVGLATVGGAVLGGFLPRFSTAILLAVFGLSMVFVVMAKPQSDEGPKTLLGQPDGELTDRRLTVGESLAVTRACALDLVDGVKSAARALRPVDWVILAAVGLGLPVFGLFLGRLAGPLVFSLLGAALIFAGLTTLLVFKGSAPIALVQTQGAFFGWVLLGMVLFGTLEQLVLCPAPRHRRRAESERSRPRQGESERGWRGR